MAAPEAAAVEATGGAVAAEGEETAPVFAEEGGGDDAQASPPTIPTSEQAEAAAEQVCGEVARSCNEEP